jgi:deoxyribose-phosphate aldolase
VLLRPDVTPGEVDDACASAVESGLAAVTVWPADVPCGAAATDGSRVTVVAAIARPNRTAPGVSLAGATGTAPAGVVGEARRAIRGGAGHLAVALDLAGLPGEDAAGLVGELAALCRMAHAEGVHVRAVLQTPTSAGRPPGAGLAEAARLAVEAGVDLLQTSFGIQGHATAEQVRTVRLALPRRHAAIGVIAGGAEDASAARHLLERAGAARVALVDPAAVLRGVAAA